MKPNLLEMVIRAVREFHGWSLVDQWGCDLEVHPKWHKMDRLSISGQRSTGRPGTFFQAHFRIRQDGVGLSFRPGDDCLSNWMAGWSEIVMKGGWDETAVSSAIWACIFLWAVPESEQRKSLGMPDYVEKPSEYSSEYSKKRGPVVIKYILSSEFKDLQVKLRKCSVAAYRPSDVPHCVNKAHDLLRKRFAGLTGTDVREALQNLEKTFRFLHSRDVPFDRVREVWDETAVAEVMEG